MSVWEDCPVIEAVPGKCSGRWVFARTRLPVYLLFGHLSAGKDLDEFYAAYGMGDSEKEKSRPLLRHLSAVLEEVWKPGPYLNDVIESKQMVSG